MYTQSSENHFHLEMFNKVFNLIQLLATKSLCDHSSIYIQHRLMPNRLDWIAIFKLNPLSPISSENNSLENDKYN